MSDDVQTADPAAPLTIGDAPRAAASVAVPGGSGLAIRPDQSGFTSVQRAALTQIGVQDAPEADVQVFFHICQRTGLDPWGRQIYMIGRFDRTLGRTKWTIQTGIDGFRLVSERHDAYAGTADPDTEWCGEDGIWRDVWLDDTRPPVAARFTLWRHDRERPIRAVAKYAEYVELKDGRPNRMWASKASHMVGKCAEALARRKAFPQELSGLYTEDEMAGVLRDHADADVRVAPNGRDVIDVEPAAAPDAPDWPARVREYVAAGDRGALRRLAALARGARAGQEVLDEIAAAAAALDEPPADEPAPAPQETAAPPDDSPAGRRMSDRLAGEPQRKRMVLLIGEGGVTGDDDRRAVQVAMAGRPLESSKQLTNREAASIIDRLTEWRKAGRLEAEVAALVPRVDVDPLSNPSRPDEWHRAGHPIRSTSGSVTYGSGPELDCPICTPADTETPDA